MHSVQVEIQYIYVAVALCDYGRAMKYIVDPQLLKEFDRFKDTFNAYVATLGMDDMPPPVPTPLPIPGFPAPASPIPLPSPAYSPTVPAPACAIPLPSPGYAPTVPAPALAYPAQIPGTAYPSQVPANVYPPLPPPRGGHQVAATQYVPEQDLPP
ncbi:hypothetical protein GCK32_014524 [Trichostrongylus colubriformis]|uniref:Uncharacterized protein n=1 Tax=Trichostrongylus colubriformis TaxID=6319 RepID=A0AAN8F2A4_TRICO